MAQNISISADSNSASLCKASLLHQQRISTIVTQYKQLGRAIYAVGLMNNDREHETKPPEASSRTSNNMYSRMRLKEARAEVQEMKPRIERVLDQHRDKNLITEGLLSPFSAKELAAELLYGFSKDEKVGSRQFHRLAQRMFPLAPLSEIPELCEPCEDKQRQLRTKTDLPVNMHEVQDGLRIGSRKISRPLIEDGATSAGSVEVNDNSDGRMLENVAESAKQRKRKNNDSNNLPSSVQKRVAFQATRAQAPVGAAKNPMSERAVSKHPEIASLEGNFGQSIHFTGTKRQEAIAAKATIRDVKAYERSGELKDEEHDEPSAKRRGRPKNRASSPPNEDAPAEEAKRKPGRPPKQARDALKLTDNAVTPSSVTTGPFESAAAPGTKPVKKGIATKIQGPVPHASGDREGGNDKERRESRITSGGLLDAKSAPDGGEI